MANKKVENEVLIAVLCYLLVGIIWFFADSNVKNNSKLVKYHSKQALNLLIISFGFFVIFGIISTILTIITIGLFALIAGPLFLFANIFFLIIWIIGIVNASNSNEKALPLIGNFAQKYLTY